MPKNSKKQIDSDEKKVIRSIQKNAKESIDRLAKKCGFSRQKVWRIIKRLEKNQTIWGYHAVIDDEKIKQKTFLMLIKRNNQPMGEAVDKLIKATIDEIGQKTNVNVLCNCYLHGCYDWMLCFSAENIQQAKKFSENLNQEFSKYISEIHIMEQIFPLRKCQLLNPNITRLKEFF